MRDVFCEADVTAGNVGQAEPSRCCLVGPGIAQTEGFLSTANYSRETLLSGHLLGRRQVWAICLGTLPREDGDRQSP